MKRLLLLLTVCMLTLAMPAGCAAEAPPPEPVGIASPLHECADLAELLAACPGVVMNDVQGPASQDILEPVTDVTYLWIEGEPPTAQIEFIFNGHEYTYRAASCASAAEMIDIAGVYEEFAVEEELPSNDNSMSGGYYTMQSNTDNAKGLCTWYYEPTGCQYSLWTPDGAGDGGEMQTVMDYLLPIR